MAPSTFSRLGALFLLSLSFVNYVEADKITFTKTRVPRDATNIYSRGLHVGRTVPSRITPARHLRVEKRQSTDEPDPKELLEYYYTAPITVGGQEYIVILDTTNTDLVLDSAPAENYEATDVRVVMNYTYGPESVLEFDGSVALSPIDFGSYHIDQQAFLDIEVEDDKFFETFGFNGIFGLGLEYTQPSQIEQAVKAAEGESSTRGRSVLQNIFAANHSLERFLAIDLGRKDDTRDIEGIELSIGEYPEAWSEIKETPVISLYPANADPGSWNILIDSLSVEDGTEIDLTSKVDGVPAGKAVAHLTIGQPETYLPTAVFDELYGMIEGAAGFTTEDGEKRWLIPCLTITYVQLGVEGRTFFIHPLDISEVWDMDKPDVLADHTVCISTFRGLDNEKDPFDITLGASFMRNVQAVFGFPQFGPNGNVIEPPYVLLQADTEEVKIETQVELIRGKELESLPEELAPADAVALLKGSSSSGQTSATHSTATHSTADATTSAADRDHTAGHGNNRHTSTHTASSHGTTQHDSSAKTGDSNSNSDGGNVLSSVAGSGSSDSSADKFMPAVLGLLGANIVVGLILIVLAVLNYIKRGGNGKRTGAHVYVPVKPSEGS